MLRFAPSPTGFLHLGHVASALANERMACALGRPLTVRMEDIDTTRARAHFEDAILDDLAWLGIDWCPPMRRQSAHFGDYAAALEQLSHEGFVYPSFATRREIAEAAHRLGLRPDPDGGPRVRHDTQILGEIEHARRRADGTPAAWRLHMEKAVAATGALTWVEVSADGGDPCLIPADPLAWGDVVLARKETPTSYHLSVTVDDAAQAITHVVRGCDLRCATAVHRVLQTLLGLPAPAYHHHPLVMGPDGRKLSKSNGAESLAALREAGLSPDDVRCRAQAAVTSGARATG